MSPITKPTHKDNNGRTWHVYLREDMSVVVFYTLPNDPAHYIKYDDLDRPADLAAENARLREALETIAAGNPAPPGGKWLSDSEMATIARAALAGGE